MPSVVRIHLFPHSETDWSCVCRLRRKRCSDAVYFCGSSSVDRASAFQAEGREFEPRLPLYKESGTSKRCTLSFLFLFCRLKYRLCSKPELFPSSLAVPRSIAGCSEAIGEKSKKQPFLRRGVEIYKDNPHELSTEPSSYRSKKNFSSFFSGKKEKKSE